MKKIVTVTLLVFISILIVLGTTWYEAKVKCPICEKINKFQRIGSYGSYIYFWPEKLQLIYWPVTVTYSVYSCQKCKYSSFMWDFSRIGNDTLDIIKSALPKLNLKVNGYKDNMTNKLQAAEKIYKLYYTDPLFWCRFYRILGYHFDADSNKFDAQIARKKALQIADSLLNMNEYNDRKKELLFISGSMNHFINQDSVALRRLNQGKDLKYSYSKADSANNSNYDSYLNGLFQELTDIIEKK